MSALPTGTMRAEDLYARFVVPTAKRSLTLVRGEGSRVWDDRGKCFLDLGGGVAVNSLGHAHPEIQKTLARQGDTIVHTSNLFYHPWGGELARRLVELTGAGKVFFCNSGAEANEALIKVARKFGQPQGRNQIITATNSFHGRTMATLSATGQEKIHHGFEPLVPGFTHVPFNDLAAIEAALTPQTAAILVEGIQGEGGVFVSDPEYLLGLRRLADAHGVLLLLDAVQCGYFRTGRWQSYERILENIPAAESFRPDAIAMAKSLGGGFPMGAVWIREPFQDVLSPGTHGTTFGGSPLACSIALTILDVVAREELAANIRARGGQLVTALNRFVGARGVKAVRGMGGLVGLVLETEDPGTFSARLAEAGLLLIPAANQTIRVLPPLNVTADEIDEAVGIIDRVLG